jgi:hypothetical protein
MGKSSTALVVMNVHKESESIDVAIADENEARHYGRVGGERRIRGCDKPPDPCVR